MPMYVVYSSTCNEFVNPCLLQLVAQFRAAGAIPIVKTNVPQVRSSLLYHSTRA